MITYKKEYFSNEVKEVVVKSEKLRDCNFVKAILCESSHLEIDGLSEYNTCH